MEPRSEEKPLASTSTLASRSRHVQDPTGHLPQLGFAEAVAQRELQKSTVRAAKV